MTDDERVPVTGRHGRAEVEKTLTKKERRDLIRLLDALSQFLENAIECSLLPDGTPELGASRQVAADRKNWRRAEDWKIRLGRAA